MVFGENTDLENSLTSALLLQKATLELLAVVRIESAGDNLIGCLTVSFRAGTAISKYCMASSQYALDKEGA